MQKGMTAIEILIGVSIVMLILSFSAHAIALFVNTEGAIAEKTQALYLAEEELELVRLMRDGSWTEFSALADGVPHYLEIRAGAVTTTTTPESIEGFTRSFTLEPVQRGAGDDIAISGTPDSNSKYVTATVSWGSPLKTVTLTTLISDIRQP